MKYNRNFALSAAFSLSISAAFAQTTTSTSSGAVKELQPQDVKTGNASATAVGTIAARPGVSFPATPAPKAPVVPMTKAQFDEHILPSNILSQTSDVIALSYNGFRRSQLDPCGCVSHQLGGLDKEASIVKRLKELEIPTVVADAGGYVRDNSTDVDVKRSRILLKALHAMGIAAANVGYTDVAPGVDKLKSAAKDADVTLVSANIADESGKLIFPPYEVATVKTKSGEIKVGFIGVTRPRVPVVKAKNTSATADMTTPTPAPAAAGSGYTVTDEAEALKKYVPELRQKADVVVGLVYDHRDKVADMLKDAGEEAKLDIAISGEYLQPQANVLDVNGTKLVSAGYEGRQSGLITIQVKDKKVIAASNQFIEILQSIPLAADITKFVEEAKNITLTPTTVHVPAKAAAPTKLELGKESMEHGDKDKAGNGKADKEAPAKLDLGKD